MSTVGLTFTFPTDSTITQGVEYANFQQLEADANAEIVARYLAKYDNTQWDSINAAIGAMVAVADDPTLNGGDKSAIYDQIMIIITSKYLPTVSNFLGDQIYEQAAIQNLSSDISAFLADGQNGYNTLAGSSFDTTSSDPASTCIQYDSKANKVYSTCDSTASETSREQFFQGVSILVYGGEGVSGSSYDFSFTVNYTQYDSTTQSLVTHSYQEENVLAFLTDTRIWGDTTPLSADGSSQINDSLLSTISIFNSGTAGTVENSWEDQDLEALATAPLIWSYPYGASSFTTTYGAENAPLVYTEPNSVQSNFNQATQAVQTVATSTQTIQNFQIQEIDQFYGITNSIQSSQQQQCSSMVKKQIV